MNGRYPRFALRTALCLSLVFAAATLSFAQIDPDPNSPTPVLLTASYSNRALAAPEAIRPRGRNPIVLDEAKLTQTVFEPASQAVIFMTNVDLLPDEGANAFRVYGRDEKDHLYMFPVVSVEPSKTMRLNLFQITIQLIDQTGFWDTPPSGAVALYLTWRGLASNEVKLAIGSFDGKVKDSPNAAPMPVEKAAAKAMARSIKPNFVGYKWSGDRRRFLEQATFGPTQALDDRIRRIGLRVWLAEQFSAPYASLTSNCSPGYPTINDPLAYPCVPILQTTPPSSCDGQNNDDSPATCNRDTYSMYPIQTWNSRYALYGDAQLRHRVAWALSQIWVTSGVDIPQSRAMVDYHKILSNNAFGNFRTIMQQMTLDATMGDYLSAAGSTKNNPNENYARELMQLFTIGLVVLNADGTAQCVNSNPCQAGDTPIATYDQNGVNNMTKVITGWNLCSLPASCPNIPVSGGPNYIDPMLLNATANQNNFNNNQHDLTAKTIVFPGHTTVNVAACPTTGSTACAVTTGVTTAQAYANTMTYANASLNQTLDALFNHPNVGPFISTRLIQAMVTSNPTPAYVGRVAAVFNDNGFGVRGDMQAVVKAILLDPEARGDNKTDPNYGKLREPVQYATNILRAFNVKSADGSQQSDGVFFQRGEFQGMAQIPFRSPTVFNYYPPDFVIPGTALIGPEFNLMTTGTAVSRASFVNRLVYTAPVINGNTTDTPLGTSVDFTDLQALSTADSTGGLILDELNNRMLHGTMSAQMRNTIQTAVQGVSASDAQGRARMAVYLVATSSQYQVQR